MAPEDHLIQGILHGAVLDQLAQPEQAWPSGPTLGPLPHPGSPHELQANQARPNDVHYLPEHSDFVGLVLHAIARVPKNDYVDLGRTDLGRHRMGVSIPRDRVFIRWPSPNQLLLNDYNWHRPGFK